MFFFGAEKISIMHIHHIFLSPSSVVGYLSWFHELAVVNSSAVNTDGQASLMCLLDVLGLIPSSGRSGS